MEIKEVQEVFDELKKQGYTDEDLLKGLAAMYEDDSISKGELEGLCEVLGVELTDEFKNAKSDEEAKKLLWESEDTEPAEGLTDKQVAASEEDPDGKEPPSDRKGYEKDEDEKEEKESDAEEEKKKAFGLMGL